MLFGVVLCKCVTSLTTLVGGGGKSTTGIRKFDLGRRQVKKGEGKSVLIFFFSLYATNIIVLKAFLFFNRFSSTQ